MAYIDTYLLQQSSVLKIYSEMNEIIVNPEYQRNGDIWPLEKRQLLIDSILNEYDIPKIYFHKLADADRIKTGKQFSIIDGRQRLETIWGFINGNFPIADDFRYLKDPTIKASGLTYADLAKKYPKLKIKFDAITLPIVAVSTDDMELVEDMFSRLNEAVPLNSAEKRNAFGGIMAKVITKISKHIFFKENVSFSNKRYQHKESSAKILFLVYCLTSVSGKIIDTKKIYLDQFVKNNKKKKEIEFLSLKNDTTTTLDEMSNFFIKNDPLLRAQGTLPIYFLLIREYLRDGKILSFTRKDLIKFHNKIKENKKIAEKNISNAEFDLLEFDRLSQQGTNDASSIAKRLTILKEQLQKII